jgi:Spy/CpxP family protein refolding chaperone
MFTKVFVLALAVLVALPAAGLAAQRRRFGQMNRMAGLQPAQVWRLTTLTLEQRRRLHELQTEAFRELQGAGGRREKLGALREMQAEVERVLTPEQLEAARAMDRGRMAPEELLYYPITSLRDLDPARRAKIEAVFTPILEKARERGGPEKGADRQRRMAYYEVIDALLTTEQMATVNGFLPDQLRRIGLKERVVFRLPSLTLEQEAEAKAIFAALEDETGADRARLKALNGELKGGDGERQKLFAERRELQQRVSERERKAYADLARVLGPEQMKELEGQRPGPPRRSSSPPRRSASSR